MKERFYLLFLYFTFWLVYFICARVVFLSYHIVDTQELTLGLIFGIFKNGIRQDLSITAMLSFFPFLLITFSHYIKKSIVESFLFSYTLICVFILTLIIVIDLEVFNVWKFRIDKTPLNYLRSPREALASVKSSPIFQLIISYLFLLIIASIFVYRVIANRLSNWNHIEKFPFIALSLLLSAALYFPMKGSLTKDTLSDEKQFFSSNYFANNATLNANWHFFSTLFKNDATKINPYSFVPRIDVEIALKKLFGSKETENKQNQKLLLKSNPNVLFIICESLSSKNINYKIDNKEVTPFLNQLSKEGIFFSNLYAAGDHTEDGLIALLNGYPSLPTNSMIYESEKIKDLQFLTKEFNKRNFSTEFYYGGYTSFINLDNYLMASDFKQTFDASSFPDSLKKSEWGVFDHNIFDQFLIHHTNTKPFFSAILTVSSHEPFEIPTKPLFNKQREDIGYLNAINYLDSSLKKFIENAKKQPWWSTTLIVIVGDHGHRFPLGFDRIEDFKIPMIWTGGAVTSAKTISSNLSQFDIAQLISNELDFKQSFKWAKINPIFGTKHWSFFAFNDGLGFVDADGKLLYDNIGKTEIISTFTNKKEKIHNAKSLQQAIYDDYLSK